MKEGIADKKLSRRQFMGTAAVGAAALGAAAGAAALIPKARAASVAREVTDSEPHVVVAGERISIPVAKTASRMSAAQASSGTATWSAPTSWDYSADVVVVGDGFAGTCAAIGAYDAGASVLILEKAPQGLDGGNSAVAGGSSKIITPLTDMITVANMGQYGMCPLDVITTTMEEISNLPTWISSLGGTLLPGSASTTTGFPPPLYAGFVSPDLSVISYRISVPSFSYPTKTGATGSSGSGKDLWAFLNYCRESRNIPIMYQTPATSLIQNPVTNEILGVVATNWTGQTINVQANKAVVLACGGYENNPEMLMNFAPESPRTEPITFAGSPYNTGDGIYMSQQVGAKLWHLNMKDCLWTASAVGSAEIGVGLVLSGVGKGCTGAATYPVIYVNKYGSRFMNEYCYSGHTDQTKEYDIFNEKFTPSDSENMCDWPNIPFYAIFDSKCMQHGPLGPVAYPGAGFATDWYAPVHNLYSWSEDNSVELAKGWIVTADDPQDLGAKITCRDYYGNVTGMNAAGLAAQVTAWNNMCTAGADTQFGRPTTTLLPLTNPPFYAIELAECYVNTNGGPVHDSQVRALDLNDNPIPRLYTPGELGSMWSKLYWGSGNVPEAMAMGRVAGVNAAALSSWS